MKQRYGRLIDGALRIHGFGFPIENENGGVTVTNDPKLLAPHGFKPVTENPAQPPDGYIAAGYTWTETDNDIRRMWEYVPVEDNAPTVEERLDTVELLLLEMLGVEI